MDLCEDSFFFFFSYAQESMTPQDTDYKDNLTQS